MAHANGRNTANRLATIIEGTGRKLLTYRNLCSVLKEHKEEWRSPQTRSLDAAIKLVCRTGRVTMAALKFPSRPETRYVVGQVNPYSLALSVAKGAYLTHLSAIQAHGWTEQIPRTVYVNVEQSPKPPNRNPLTQEAIDQAFRRKPRRTKRIAGYDDRQIVVLSGMHTGRAGVIEMEGDDGLAWKVTGIERTLIDSVVRPFYAGGIGQVLEAFRAAAPTVSPAKLASLLEGLNYTYPYHQSVGFLMERANAYREDQIAPFRALPKQYDFYLTYQMEDPRYSPEWRLFFPKGL